MTFKPSYWKSNFEKSSSSDALKSHKKALRPRTIYIWCTRNESVVGCLLGRHCKNSRNILPWMESVRFLTGITSGAFQYPAGILFYLKASYRDDEDNVYLHEPCRWWSGSLPYRFFQFSRDLAWRPLLSFPFLFLEELGGPILCRNKDYGANLRILGCIIFKIQITTKFWLQ